MRLTEILFTSSVVKNEKEMPETVAGTERAISMSTDEDVPEG